MKKAILTLFGVVLMATAGLGDVLLWSVNSSATVDGDPIASFISPLPDDDDNWAVCRLRMTTAGGEVRYLDLTDPGNDINSVGTTYDGSEGVWIGGGGEFFGAEWNQSVLPSDTSGASFLIELGMNHYNANTDAIDFELLAVSDIGLYENLQTFIYQQHDLNPLTATPWTPLVYSTPEPNSFTLLAVGLALLVLRRKSANT